MPEVVRNVGTAASRVLADAMAKAEVVQVEGLTLPTVTPIVGEAISRSLVERAGQPVRTVSPALVGRLKKLPKRVDHRRWQSEGSRQFDRGTCWAFAGIAALEAAYRRVGIDVRLSQEFLIHMVRSWANQQKRTEHVHSLCDFMGSADVLQHLSRLNVPQLSDAPYFNRAGLSKIWTDVGSKAGPVDFTGGPGSSDRVDWFEYDQAHIPLAARWAANWGVRTFGTVNGTVDGIRTALAAGHEVVVDVWDKINVGQHTLLVYGYDDDAKTFLIKNSQTATAFATMDYYNDAQFDLGGDPALHKGPGTAYFVTEVKQPQRQTHPAWVGPWTMDNDGWRGRLIIRRYCDLWATGSTLADSSERALDVGTWYPEDGAPATVHGWFEQDGQALTCTINDQPFKLSLFGWELDRAAGVTAWRDSQFSVVLSRGVISGGPALTATTRASATAIWECDHDGQLGTLSNGDKPSYIKTSDGTRFPVRLAGGKDHRFDLDINWSATGGSVQRFEFLAHTRETGIAGGLTRLDGASYGLSARVAASLYVVRSDGRLDQFRHTGRPTMSFDWESHTGVGVGWNGVRVIGGGDGVIYVITPDGRLRWAWHRGRATGTFDWVDFHDVGTGWQDPAAVLAGEGGLLYAIMPNGDVRWFRHLGRRTGAATWEGPSVVANLGIRWFQAITAGPDGVFYAIDPLGRLLWWRHLARAEGRPVWAGPRIVSTGWESVDTLIATGSGYLYARRATKAGDPGSGELWLHNHLGYRTGENSWRPKAKVGTGWTAGVSAIFAT